MLLGCGRTLSRVALIQRPSEREWKGLAHDVTCAARSVHAGGDPTPSLEVKPRDTAQVVCAPVSRACSAEQAGRRVRVCPTPAGPKARRWRMLVQRTGRAQRHATPCHAMLEPSQPPACGTCVALLRVLGRSAGKFAEKVMRSTSELESVVTIIHANEKQMRRHDPLRMVRHATCTASPLTRLRTSASAQAC